MGPHGGVVWEYGDSSDRLTHNSTLCLRQGPPVKGLYAASQGEGGDERVSGMMGAVPWGE